MSFYLIIILSLICISKYVYLECLSWDIVAQSKSDFIYLLLTVKQVYKLFCHEHNLTFIFLAIYKQLQVFLLQQERASKYPYSFLLYFIFLIFLFSSTKYLAFVKNSLNAILAKVSQSSLKYSFLHIYI